MKTLIIACLAVLTAGASAQEAKSDAAPIFAEAVVQSWGYRTTKYSCREQSEWEAKHFGKASIRLQWIKSTQELKDWKNTYYRFRIAEETYGSLEEAKKRIERIHDTPPGLDTKSDPHWVLCDGVAAGKTAYLISTDSVKLSEALPVVKRLVSAKVAGK